MKTQPVNAHCLVRRKLLWEGWIGRGRGDVLSRATCSGMACSLACWGQVSAEERVKPVREVGVAEIVGIETLGQFDTMYPAAGVLGQCVGDFSAGRAAGIVTIEHHDDP